MLIEIYILLACFTIGIAVLSFFRKEIFTPLGRVIMMWFCVVLFLSLALVSAQIESVFCANSISSQTVGLNVTNYTSAWSCHTNSYESVPLIYLWGGFGLIMFVYALIMSIMHIIEKFQEQAKDLEKKDMGDDDE